MSPGMGRWIREERGKGGDAVARAQRVPRRGATRCNKCRGGERRRVPPHEHNKCRGGPPHEHNKCRGGGAGATSTGAHLRMNGRVGELDWEGRNKRPLRNKRGAQQVRGGREHVEGTAQQVRWNGVAHDFVLPCATSVHWGGAVGLPRGFSGGRAQLWVPTRLCLLRHRVTVHKLRVRSNKLRFPPTLPVGTCKLNPRMLR